MKFMHKLSIVWFFVKGTSQNCYATYVLRCLGFWHTHHHQMGLTFFSAVLLWWYVAHCQVYSGHTLHSGVQLWSNDHRTCTWRILRHALRPWYCCTGIRITLSWLMLPSVLMIGAVSLPDRKCNTYNTRQCKSPIDSIIAALEQEPWRSSRDITQ
jgi:hypothetical protein